MNEAFPFLSPRSPPAFYPVAHIAFLSPFVLLYSQKHVLYYSTALRCIFLEKYLRSKLASSTINKLRQRSSH